MCLLSHVQLSVSLADCSPPGSSVVGFPNQEYWNGLPLPSPGSLPNPGIRPTSVVSPALQADSLPLAPLGKCLSLSLVFYECHDTLTWYLSISWNNLGIDQPLFRWMPPLLHLPPSMYLQSLCFPLIVSLCCILRNVL